MFDAPQIVLLTSENIKNSAGRLPVPKFHLAGF